MPDPKPPRGRILVVEDEGYVRESLGALLRSRGFDVQLEASPDGAVRFLARAPVDAVLTDLRMDGEGGLGLLRRLRDIAVEPPVLVLTGHGTIHSAVECLKAGAADYILKPADPDALEMAIERAISRLALEREVRYLRRSAGPPAAEDTAVGTSPAWRGVMRMVQAAAPTDSTVLLLGESGTGKELLARMIHRLGRRAARPYVTVNCAAIPLEMWESEFFGHRKGSFTGASADHEGRFLLAHRGTLFLDEIGTIPPAAQAKLLRALQEGEFDRLGDVQPTRVDVRIIAATNSDLGSEVEAGRFRRDLYYRLNVVRIEVPPLRERTEDIAALAAHLLHGIAARLGRTPPAIGPGVLADLQAYPWPGNVRELQNVLERAMILEPGGTLASLDLPPVQGLAEVPGGPAPEAELNLRVQLAAREREIVVEALQRSAGVRKEAARLLGIDPRNLPYYLRKHGIEPSRGPG